MDRAIDYKAIWHQAVDEAYAVFSDYRRPGSLDSSPVEKADKILADLTSAPLRELSAIKLTAFEGSALYTVGTTFDYKHFLPRMLELMADDDVDACIYPDLVARKLNYAHFRNWPKEEVAVIQGLFRASFHVAFFNIPFNSNVENLLVGNIDVGNQLESLLVEVSGFNDANAARNIAGLVVEATTKIDERSWLGLHLTEQSKNTLRSWSRSKGVLEALYRGIDLVLDGDAWEIETALSCLG